ncbi:MarR family winged helix-turn-helix transcriptional regulator [Solirubrobacter taibaiensis]|nr:MarR family winged helix-turn-helix transcriptional regulator [Solirubrobacter taibaiensis]
MIDQPARRVGALLDQVGRQLRQHSMPALDSLGMRPRHLLTLTVLRDRAGSSQADLSTLLQIDRTNLVGLLNELEADGLIERRRSPEDRRRHLVELTRDGRELLSKAEFALAFVEDHVFGALDASQRETLYELLQLAANGEASCSELSSDC